MPASERDFRLLVDSVTDYAIFMLDPDGFVTSWNAGAERIKGYRADEIVGRHFSLFYPAEEVVAGTPRGLWRRRRARADTLSRRCVSARTVRKFWASVLIDPIRDEEGAC